jgi:LysM repeat protein
MHRDKKVGLALAILLCSVVGAFFFRDDAPHSNGPELKDGQRLDQEIAQGSRSGRHEPYSAAEGSSRTAEGRRADRSRPGFDQSELPDFLRDDSTLGGSTAQRPRVNGSRDPLSNGDRLGNPSNFNPLTPLPDDAPAVPIPLHNSDWDIAANNGVGLRRSGTEVAPATSALKRTHVVADGETLSSIAGKYLGSQARYQEIFQANRDQLTSPNDLKIGMKLTIPDRNETRATQGQRSAPKVDSATRTAPSTNPSSKRVSEHAAEPTGAADARKPKFKPAKNGSAIRRTTDASDTDSPSQTLSQVAPDDVLEIDEGLLAELERDVEPRLADKADQAAEPK